MIYAPIYDPDYDNEDEDSDEEDMEEEDDDEMSIAELDDAWRARRDSERAHEEAINDEAYELWKRANRDDL